MQIPDWQGKLLEMVQSNCARWVVILLLTFTNFDSSMYCINYKVWYDITYPFLNCDAVVIDVWEWITNFMPHTTCIGVYLSMLGLKLIHVGKWGPGEGFCQVDSQCLYGVLSIRCNFGYLNRRWLIWCRDMDTLDTLDIQLRYFVLLDDRKQLSFDYLFQ